MKHAMTWGSMWALLALMSVHAEETSLTPEQVGKIQYEEQQAMDKVSAQYGNRKSSEMSQSERGQMIQDQRQAVQDVHEKSGVSEKDYARYSAHMNPDDRATAKNAQKAAEKAAIKKEVQAEQASSGGPQVVPYNQAVPAKTVTAPSPPRMPSRRTSRKSKSQ